MSAVPDAATTSNATSTSVSDRLSSTSDGAVHDWYKVRVSVRCEGDSSSASRPEAHVEENVHLLLLGAKLVEFQSPSAHFPTQ